MKPEGSAERQKFSPGEVIILSTFARVIIPRGGSFALGADDINLGDRVADYLGRFPRLVHIGYRLLLHLANISAFFFTFRPFTRLSPEKQTKFLESWETSRIFARRGIFIPLKMPIMMVFYGDPRVQQVIGYQPECASGRRVGP